MELQWEEQCGEPFQHHQLSCRGEEGGVSCSAATQRCRVLASSSLLTLADALWALQHLRLRPEAYLAAPGSFVHCCITRSSCEVEESL